MMIRCGYSAEEVVLAAEAVVEGVAGLDLVGDPEEEEVAVGLQETAADAVRIHEGWWEVRVEAGGGWGIGKAKSDAELDAL